LISYLGSSNIEEARRNRKDVQRTEKYIHRAVLI